MVLIEHPAVTEAAVVVREDTPGEKQLVAYIVGSATGDFLAEGLGGASDENSADPRKSRNLLERVGEKFSPARLEHELQHYLQNRLPHYMLPSCIMQLPLLPLNTNLKVDRKALPKPTWQAVDQATTEDLPCSPTEKLLAEIWCDILARPFVGIHEHFFEAGGHSLLATRLVVRIRDTFQVEVPLRSIFEAPTIAKMASMIEQMQTALLVDQVTGDDLSEMLAQIDQLTADEIAMLLGTD